MALTTAELEVKLKTWQSIATEVPIQINGQIQGNAQGRVYLKQWSEKEKVKHAGKALGIIWALAFLSIAVPIAHFVLVPSFFIAGPIVALTIFNRDSSILGGVGECPDCHQTFDISKSKVEWPMKDVCSHCYHHLVIEKT